MNNVMHRPRKARCSGTSRCPSTGSSPEIDLHIAPVLLGDGIRLYDNPGGTPVRLHATMQDDPSAELSVRYRPVVTP